MTQYTSVLDELKKLIGTEMVVTAPEEISRGSIRYFAQALGDTNPVYFDEEYAKKTRYGGIIAPPTLICETMQYLVGEVDETGGPGRRFKFGLSLGMQIRAGNDYEFFQPFRPDDILTARWKVTDVYEKHGKTGILYFLRYDITYTNQRDELLAINHETIVFRGSEVE